MRHSEVTSEMGSGAQCGVMLWCWVLLLVGRGEARRSFETEYIMGNITNLLFNTRGVVVVVEKVPDERPPKERLCSTQLNECLLSPDFPNAGSTIAWMMAMMEHGREIFVRPERCDEQGHFYLIKEVGGLSRALKENVLRFYAASAHHPLT